jgi:uncharacterized membrane protein YecN with MAPEG domain
MVPFFENTWLIWWVLAVLVILRWLHQISVSPTVGDSRDQEY